MDVIKEREYKIVPVGQNSCTYFEKKYGTPNPTIRIEERDNVLWPNGGWGMQNGNPACLLFGMRTGLDKMIPNETWYGHITTKDGWGFGELVCESELEALK